MASVRDNEAPVSKGSQATDLLAKRLYYIEMHRARRSQPTTVDWGQLRQLVGGHLANLAPLGLVHAVCRVEAKNKVYSRITSNSRWIDLARLGSDNVRDLLQSMLVSTVHRGAAHEFAMDVYHAITGHSFDDHSANMALPSGDVIQAELARRAAAMESTAVAAGEPLDISLFELAGVDPQDLMPSWTAYDGADQRLTWDRLSNAQQRGLERHGYDVGGIEYRNGETVIGFAMRHATAADIVGLAAVNDAPVAEQYTARLVQNGVRVRAELGDYTLDELVERVGDVGCSLTSSIEPKSAAFGGDDLGFCFCKTVRTSFAACAILTR